MARDPYRYFRVEARELLEQLGKGALELDKGDSAPDLIARMLRSAHTLKGAARVGRTLNGFLNCALTNVALLEPGMAVTRRTSPGGAGPGPVAVQLKRFREQLERFRPLTTG